MRAVVQRVTRASVRVVAEGMIAAQTAEIDAMRSIQSRLSCTP